ncbi:ATP-binding protein [Acidovorax sp. A79]|uniref:sensor histidine kinase n=1 Tax=Acidovorax sp. A79 TaxID=3056107 RepID=UPI0034E89F9A
MTTPRNASSLRVLPAADPLRDASSGDLSIPARAGTTLRWRWRHVVVLAACALCGAVAYVATFTFYREEQARGAAKRLEFVVLSLQALVHRNEALPGIIGLKSTLGSLLDTNTLAAQAAANAYLETVAKASGISAVYLLDAGGTTLASSNWNQVLTFVGENYAYRPYFKDAMAGRTGRFYGIGSTTGEAGYFLAAGVVAPGGARGVIAVKLSLEKFEEAMRQSTDVVILTDREGVVILSSVPEWRYRTVAALAPAARERIRQSRQYGDLPLLALPGPGLDFTRSHATLALEGGITHYTMATHASEDLGWRAALLVDQAPSRRAAVLAALAATSVAAFLGALTVGFQEGRYRREEMRKAKRALVEASARLEQRIIERTADISQANASLERKIEELRRTEAILHETRDGAVHAGKLAVLGQMSAGMGHELSQPLTALRTLSDNAITLLDGARLEEVRENLHLISELTARMGRIMALLKAFARADSTSLEPVAMDMAIHHALMLVESRRCEVRADILVSSTLATRPVRADATRLEQVLVNLMRNALDAVESRAERLVRVAVRQKGRHAVISVSDTGGGIAPEAMQRLFEPFYTTKPAGAGLGLGLALSQSIVESFGGRIEARNLDRQGALFTITLEVY